MSAERLREAARVLRERAEAAQPWPCEKWTYEAVRHIARNCDIECFHDEWDASLDEWVEGECPSPDGGWDRYKTHAYITTMHPGVGLALADWLEMVGAWIDEGLGLIPPDINIGDAWADTELQAYRLADLILGDAS